MYLMGLVIPSQRSIRMNKREIAHLRLNSHSLSDLLGGQLIWGINEKEVYFQLMVFESSYVIGTKGF